MNVKRFVLRLAVGLLCFAVGWASAVLLGATRDARTYAPHRMHTELIFVTPVAPPPPPRSALPPPDLHLHFEQPLLPTGCTNFILLDDEEHFGGSEFEGFTFEASPPRRRPGRASRER